MKTGNLLFILGLSLFLFSGCEKGIFNKEKTLIFGKFHGFCVGESCNEIYKLTSKNLYEDTKNKYITEENFKFEIAEHLLTEIPEELLDLENETIGCPDCADQGGYYIQFTDKEGTKTFKIDTFRDNVPSNLHSFLDEIETILIELN